MCIRDRIRLLHEDKRDELLVRIEKGGAYYGDMLQAQMKALFQHCLLYTSDAADERSSVDLGGRRIIKKKKHIKNRGDEDCANNIH